MTPIVRMNLALMLAMAASVGIAPPEAVDDTRTPERERHRGPINRSREEERRRRQAARAAAKRGDQ